MTARKSPPQPLAVARAEEKAKLPTRPVIEHTKLFRAHLQMEHSKANAALSEADLALANAASERDSLIELAKQKFDAIRAQLDSERHDIITTLTGIEAAMKAISPPAETVAQIEEK